MSAVLSLVLVPIYIGFLGIEAYGLIGFLVALQAALAVFDLGMGATLNREIARLSAETSQRQKIGEFVRTAEILCWLVGSSMALSVWLLGPWVSDYWIRPGQIGQEALREAISLFSVVIFFQWPQTFYRNGLMGLQEQVICNVATIFFVVVQGLGAIIVLSTLSSTIWALLLWQACANGLQTAVLGWLLWRRLPIGAGQPRFCLESLRPAIGFATSMSLTSVAVILLGQMDKMLLGRLLPLDVFGQYVLATTITSALAIPAAPVTDAVLPRYVYLVQCGEESILKMMFHRVCQVIAWLVFPLTAIVAVFPHEIVFLWTGVESLASNSATVLGFLALGAGLNVMMSSLDLLQMAHGWLKPAMISRLVAMCVLAPCMLFLVPRMGLEGAGIAWLIVYLSYVIIAPHFVYRRLLKTEKARWYFRDMLFPFAISCGIGVLWRVGIQIPGSRISLGIYLLSLWAATSLVLIGCLPSLRQDISQVLKNTFRSKTSPPLAT
jgi:O-antigen/teichoic acid export membrane protein